MRFNKIKQKDQKYLGVPFGYRSMHLMGYGVTRPCGMNAVVQLDIAHLAYHYLRTLQYSAVQYSTVQHSPAQYSMVQYISIEYSNVQYATIQYSTVQNNNVLYRTIH